MTSEIITQKSRRREVVITDDNDQHAVTVKFWDDSMSLAQDLTPGQKVKIENVFTSTWGGRVSCGSSSDTQVSVRTICIECFKHKADHT